MEYRGIIHNHSACSKEGCYPLSVLRQRWVAHLDFAAMTEHAERTSAEDYASYVRECEALSDERFRFIPGLEVATESGDMLLLGCRRFICTRNPLQVLSEAVGCFILLAHPEEGKVIPEVLEQAHGLEGWNGGHMGGYMPPIDWLSGWRKLLSSGKVLTGGNDIHKVDPKRKILTLVRVDEQPGVPIGEEGILEAMRQGHFLTTNGIFSVGPDGHVFCCGYKVSDQLLFRVFACCYRLSWRGVNACLQLGGIILAALGVDKQRRTRLNRLLRQHL
jgi:hypothetical protein